MVVVDLTVPGGTGGVEVLRQIRALDPAAKVIISSGYAGPEDLTALGAQGFTAVLPKPYTVEDARAVIGPHLPVVDAPPAMAQAQPG